MADKPQIRKKYISIRKAMLRSDKEIFAKSAASIFLQHIDVRSDNIIGIYYPMSSEISTLFLAEELVNIGCKLALPTLINEQGDMIFKEWQIDDELFKDDFCNIYVPGSSNKEIIPDIVVVPMVGFNKGGYRIGYGKGCYDRLISKYKQESRDVKFIGYAYSIQLVDDLPVDYHDQQLDVIIVDDEAIFCK